MNLDQKHELAALSALQALNAPEANLVRELTEARDPEFQAALESLSGVTRALNTRLAPTPPPEGLLDRILAALPAQENGPTPTAKPLPGLEATAAQPFRFLGKTEGAWLPSKFPGVRVRPMSINASQGYAVVMVELAPGTEFPEHQHHGPEDLYMLTGTLRVEGRELSAGDFHHAEPGSHHSRLFSEHGCTALMVLPARDFAPELA